jgi:hypothetical protein
MKERQIILPDRKSKNVKARPVYADDLVFSVLEGQKRRQKEDGVESFPFVFHRIISTGGARTERKKNRRLEGIEEFVTLWD